MRIFRPEFHLLADTVMRRHQPDPPRLRKFKCRHVYHVYQRGSYRQDVFRQPAHLLLYLNRLDRLARRCKVRIHAYCLMSNHVHFMFEPQRKGAISKLMQHLQSYHARYMNGLQNTQGHLWRHHFHAKPITSSAQYRNTLVYIEQNPTAAAMTKQAHLYPYSSAQAHLNNDASYTVKHKGQSATIRIYLDRWRKEFEIPATGPSQWAAWLLKRGQAEFAKSVALMIGKPPRKPTALPFALPAKPTAAAASP